MTLFNRSNAPILVTTLLLVLAAFVSSAILYDRLPDPMPTHWGITGEADGFTAKPWGPFAMPVAMALIVGLLLALPAISPKGFRIDANSSPYRWTVAGVTALLFGIQVTALRSAMSGESIGNGFALLFGAFFVVLGNILPTMRRNFFMGVRTPWTLADEEVWVRTHRVSGRLFVAGGIAMLLLAAAGAPVWASFAVIVPVALAPVVLSFLIYRRVNPVR